MRDQRPMSEGRDRGAGAGEARRSVRTARAAPRRRGVGVIGRVGRAGGLRRRCSGRERRLPRLTARACGRAVRGGNQRAVGLPSLFIDRDGVIQETKDPYSFRRRQGSSNTHPLRRRAASTIRVPPPSCSPTGASSSAHIPREIWSRPERSGVPPNRSGKFERRRPLPTDTGFWTGSSDARYREAG